MTPTATRRQRDSAENSGTFSNTTDSVCRMFRQKLLFLKNIHSQTICLHLTKAQAGQALKRYTDYNNYNKNIIVYFSLEINQGHLWGVRAYSKQSHN